MNRAKVTRLIDTHFRELTRVGLLSDSAIYDTLITAGMDSFHFSVHSHERDVVRLQLTGPKPLPNEHTKTFSYENCRLTLPALRRYGNRQQILFVLRHCQLVLVNTLVWRNLQKIKHRPFYKELHKELQGSLDSNRRLLPVELLTKVFRQQLKLSVEIVERINAPGHPFYIRRRSVGQSRDHAVRMDAPGLTELIDKEALGKANTLDVTAALKPNASKKAGPIILVPICRSNSPRSTRSQLFLLRGSNKRPLTLEDITSVEALTTFFLDEVLNSRQRQYIIQMLSEIVSVSAVDGTDSIESKYRQVLTRSLRRIVTDTVAYRCSVWLLDSRDDFIVPHEMATYEKGCLQTKYTLAIDKVKASDTHCSSLAYVMSGAEGDGYLLVNDVRAPAKDLKGKNIMSLIVPSGDTQSELCVQLRENAVPSAVLLAESRLDRGLDSDRWFIQAVCALLAEYKRALQQRLDSSYISERLSLFDTSHDLEVFIRVHLAAHPEIQEKLLQFLRLGKHDVDLDRKEDIFTVRQSWSLSKATTAFLLRKSGGPSSAESAYNSTTP